MPDTQRTYFPISLYSIRVDSIPSFDLFLFHKSNDRYVLYREKNLRFAQDTLNNLLRNDTRELHVPREQRDDYFDYSSRMVADVIADPEITPKEKSQVVYKTTANIMEDLFVTPRSSTRIRQAKEVIGHAVNFLVNDPEATRNMIFLTEHDYYTYTHSVNVTIFATALAQRIFGPESPEHDLRLIGEGFLLHDIGKSTIPASIINKPGKLNDTEWALMRQHPQRGFQILQEAGQENDIINRIVLEHHERPDGRGYPRGLKADEIHPYSKICCIADVFDAITTVRSYRDPLTTFEALRVMRDDMGDHFDWDCFNEFVKLFRDD